MADPTCIAVIPARIGSTRLPRKVLADLCGRPLLWHVWQRVGRARRIADRIVATDSEEVAQVVRSWGGRVILTSPELSSGTARIAAIVDQLPGDLFLNVQGDEPLIDARLLDAMVEKLSTTDAPLVTAAWRITNAEEIRDPNVVKLVRASAGRALYFSRSPIPYLRDVPAADWLGQHVFWGHVGVYGYHRAALLAYAAAPEGPLETAERLEQLRFLDLGMSFDVVEAAGRTQAVDTHEDLRRVAQLMSLAKDLD